eukprot:symbB.v1.2.027907.t1/scaffold2899.1/size67670/7
MQLGKACVTSWSSFLQRNACLQRKVLLRHSAKSAPFTCLAHAGRGLYDLQVQACEYQNFREGIHTLERSQIRSAAIIQYLSQMKAFNEDKTRFYLGSPALATRFLRPRDHAILLEASMEVYKALKQSLTHLNVKDGVRILHANSYLWLQDHLVPMALHESLYIAFELHFQ